MTEGQKAEGPVAAAQRAVIVEMLKEKRIFVFGEGGVNLHDELSKIEITTPMGKRTSLLTAALDDLIAHQQEIGLALSAEEIMAYFKKMHDRHLQLEDQKPLTRGASRGAA